MKAHFSSLRQKDHHMSKSCSPFRWGHQVLALDCVQLSSEYPQGWNLHYLSEELVPTFSHATPNTGQRDCSSTVTPSPLVTSKHQSKQERLSIASAPGRSALCLPGPSPQRHPAPCCNPGPKGWAWSYLHNILFLNERRLRSHLFGAGTLK